MLLGLPTGPVQAALPPSIIVNTSLCLRPPPVAEAIPMQYRHLDNQKVCYLEQSRSLQNADLESTFCNPINTWGYPQALGQSQGKTQREWQTYTSFIDKALFTVAQRHLASGRK